MTEVNDDTANQLKQELSGLFKYVQRIRQEIASIHHPEHEEHQLLKMADQLDAIVTSTEKATNTIMETVELNEGLSAKLREKVTDPAALALIDEMSKNNMDVFEACSFQDLTGQRVSKILKSIRYVEDRVSSLMEIWGKQALLEEKTIGEEKKTEDESLLSGPQLEGKGISQDEIDKLFD
ncbi:MAG: protein phosphatase CheZ [Rhodospirillales bacterium]|nr:protein phosphatase CheZ [Rhodospirillales bacterium]MCW8860803.1 protein phosphatase CheZ [Rhodospirillales bacterium]MCW8952067.1 protein phosphatase CheZ [Rhodospirillales bacterium]MCW8970016.1 protein phosphatase CheZ [Rhodospirillales bacterium]MCW9002450.1 protein phosphatase CheZ [Rhodospirillales bacterium]